MEEERLTFKITGEDGNEIECEALFTFESEETGKNYMVYTDHSTDEDGVVKVFAGIYNPDSEKGLLQPIETEQEWTIIETILAEIQEDLKSDAEESEL